MREFSRLPLELVICIIQSAEDDTDLRALCTVSKTTSAIAQPLLYREIDLEDCATVEGALSLFLLMRTITNSPQIAGWIQCLRVDAVTMCECDIFFFAPSGQIPRWNSEGKYSPYEDEVKISALQSTDSKRFMTSPSFRRRQTRSQMSWLHCLSHVLLT